VTANVGIYDGVQRSPSRPESLGRGAPSRSVFLRGDGEWAMPRRYPPTVIGRQYMGTPDQFAATSAGWVANRVVAHWFEIPQPGELKALTVRVLGAAANGTLRLGLYEPDGPNGYPGTLIVAHAGTLPTDSTGDQSAAISQRVDAIGVWAVVQTGTTGTPTTRTCTTTRLTFGRGSGDAEAGVSISATRNDAPLPPSLALTSWSAPGTANPHGLMVVY
jgi:hypothetical protein